MTNAMHESFGAAKEAVLPADSDRSFTIGDLAREFGVTLRTLRFYEDRGLLSPRRDGTARIYDLRDRDRLSVILKGKQLGFTLTEIRAMLAEDRMANGVARTSTFRSTRSKTRSATWSSSGSKSTKPWWN